jgi:hypothetical protein
MHRDRPVPARTRRLLAGLRVHEDIGELRNLTIRYQADRSKR